MNIPKLTIVTGMSGSGKSTVSQRLSLRLEEAGIPNVWIHEESLNHPVRSKEFDTGSLFNALDFERNLNVLLEAWKQLISRVLGSDKPFVMEGCFFQDIIRYFFEAGIEEPRIRRFYKDLEAVLHPAGPFLVFLYSPDAERTLKNVFPARGRRWEDLILDPGECRYFKNNGLAGDEGIYRMWREYQRLSLTIFAELSLRKLKIDVIQNEDGDFPGMVFDSLKLPIAASAVSSGKPGGDEELTGLYTDETDRSRRLEIIKDSGGLFCRMFWDYMKLEKIEGDTYRIISFPIELEFQNTGGKQTVTISGNYGWDMNGRRLLKA